MAIPNFYSSRHEDAISLGEQARILVREQTKKITEEAAAKIMQAEADMKAIKAVVQVHIDRIVSLELELYALRSNEAERKAP